MLYRNIFLLFVLGLLVGSIVLQVYLSKRESRWPGLILPIFCFGLAMMTMSGMVMFSRSSMTITEMDLYTGELIVNHLQDYGSIRFEIGALVAMFLTTHMPAGVFIAIYGVCRLGRKNKRELDVMNIQDL